jgi:3-deoxy-D-manno-octulosonic-acid transferase
LGRAPPSIRAARRAQYAKVFSPWRPDLAVFTESEIWPNLILESSARGIPLVLINGRMTKRSFRRWRRNPGVAHPLFSRFALVLAQNEGLARRFAELGVPNAIPAGNLKVDSPPPPVDGPMLERLRPAFDGRALLIAASTHDGELPSLRVTAPSRGLGLCTIARAEEARRSPSERSRLQGGAALPRRPARPQQRCLRR